MTAGSFDLQTSIYGVLNGHLPNNAVVFDGVPPEQNEVFPRVDIGHSRSYDFSAIAVTGETHIIEIHVWSRYAGRKEALEIMTAIKNLLHNQELPTSSLVLIQFVSSDDPYLDEDGATRHGVVRFRAITAS